MNLIYCPANVTIKDSKGAGSVTIGVSIDILAGTLTIEGGNFNIGYNSYVDQELLTIKGGTFNQDVSAYVDTDKYSVTDNGDGTWTVGAISEDKNVCQIGENKYESLQLAIDAAGSGDTITLLDNVEEDVTIDGIYINIERNDFNYKGKVTLINSGDLAIDEDYVGLHEEGSVTVTYENGFPKIDGSNAGDDIYSAADNAVIDMDAGNDIISNDDGYNVSINGGEGNDEISNYGNNVSINGGAGNDSIDNRSNDVSINGGAGNDSIELYEEVTNTVINVGDGNDTILGYTKDKGTINANGLTKSEVKGKNVLLTTANGTVLIKDAAGQAINLNGTNTVISAATTENVCKIGETGYATLQDAIDAKERGEDITLLKDVEEDVTIDGIHINIERGNFNYKGKVTLINGGYLEIGNEYVGLNKGSATVTYDNGFQKIDGSNEDDDISSDAENAVINVGEGNDEISNNGDNVSINSGAGNDYIYNYNDNVSINGGDGNDEIYNDGNNVSINGGAGNDSIVNYDSNVAIDGGEGNDTITNNSNDVSINGGAGDDKITNYGDDATIDGGAGNDSIELGTDSWFSNNTVINVGDGDDTILGYTKDKGTIQADGLKSSEVQGNDVLLTTEKGTVLILDAAEKPINLNGEETTIYAATTPEPTLPNPLTESGDYILMNDVEFPDFEINADGDVTIDLNGYELSIDVNFILSSGNVTIKDSKGTGSVTIDSDNIYDGRLDIISGTLKIEGGTFNRDVSEFVDQSKYSITDNGNGTWTVSAISEDKNVCEIDGTKYESLQLAINAAGSGDIITLLDNVEEDITIDGKSLKIERDGYNYKGNVKLSNNGKLIIDTEDVGLNKGSATVTYDDGFKKIDGSNDDDDISSSASNAVIDMGEGDDYIDNYGANVSINGNAGNDEIENYTYNVSISGGAGNDYIYTAGADTTIDGGAGDDYILNAGENVIIYGAVGNDSITNNGKNVTIHSGDGDDHVTNTGENVSINSTTGNDIINNSGKNVIIDGGAGNDEIYNFTKNVTIDGGAGNDKISLDSGTGGLLKATSTMVSSSGSNLIIAGEGDDTIYGYTLQEGTIQVNNYTDATVEGKDVILTTEKGSVRIIDAADVTINLNGDDTVFATPVYVCQIGDKKYESLQDAINAAKDNDTITLLEENTDNVEISGKKVTFDVGEYSYKGDVTLSKAKLTIGEDNLQVSNGSVTVSYDKGFKNIVGSDENDKIFNYAKDAVIDMNAGDDRINNSAENVKIISGEGDDIVYNYGNNVTIEDGAGNDEIYLGAVSGNIINAGEGDDTISGYNADKGTINANYTAATFGGKNEKDVILTTDKGTVTILDGADKTINLNGTDTIFAAPVYVCQIDDTKYEKLQDAIDAATPNQTITLLDNVTEDLELTSTFIIIDTKNYAYKGTTTLNSNGKPCSIAIGKDLVAILEGTATANYDDGFTSLVGSDSADSLFNYNAYVTVDGGAGDDYIGNPGTTASNAFINGSSGNDTLYNYNADVTVLGGEGNDSIVNSGDDAFVAGGEDENYIENSGKNDLVIGYKGNDTIINSGDNSTIYPGEGDDVISLKGGSGNVINVGVGNDTVYGYNLNIGTIQSEYTEVEVIEKDVLLTTEKGSALIKDAADVTINLNGTDTIFAAPVYACQIGTEKYETLQDAIDAAKSGDKITLLDDNTEDISITDKEIILDGGNYKYNGKATLIDGGKLTIGEDNVEVVSGTATATYDGGFKNVVGSDEADYIVNNANNDTIDGGKDEDSLINEGNNVVINGGEGDDGILNIGNNATINGGAGDDFIIFDEDGGGTGNIVNAGEGNDTITGYTKDNGTIKADYTAATVSGSDVLLTTENGTVLIIDAADQTINLNGKDTVISEELENTSLDGTEKPDSLVNADRDNVTINGYEADDTIRNAADNVLINGGTGNDKIKNTGDNVTMDGGAGNDSFIGGKGADTFVAAEGNDTISKLDENDVIELKERTINGVKAKGYDIILELDNGDSLTLEDGKGKTAKVNDIYTTDGPVKMQFGDGRLTVTSDDVHYAATDGKTAAVKVDKDYSGKGVFDLNNHNFNDKNAPSFYGNIKDLDASAYNGKATLIGNEGDNELTASNGNSLLNGGAGDDTLIGGNGSDTFAVAEGNGNDLIKDFEAGTDKDSDKMLVSGVIDTMGVEGENVVLSLNGKDKVTIEGIAGQTFKFENEYTNGEINMTIADKELNVKEDGYYLAASDDATVKLAEYSGNSKVADLSNGNFNEKENITFYGNDKIKELDATGYAEDIALYGNNKDNVIKAGSGNDTLWGGNGGNDTLIGGEGEDTFIYKQGNGNDEVQNAGNGDCIKLDGIDVNWCTKVCNELFVGNDVKFEFADGGSFLVKNGQAEGITYEVEGKQYSVVKNASGSEWKVK